MIQTEVSLKNFCHGHLSCQNISEKRKGRNKRPFIIQGTCYGAFTLETYISITSKAKKN